MINFLNIPKDAIIPSQKEILRYMGINNIPDEKTLLLMDEVLREMIKECDFKCCFTKLPVKTKDDKVFLGEIEVSSKSLVKNMENCNDAYLFCATIGINADRIINKYMRFSPEKGVIAQSVGATLIESVCDYANAFFKDLEKNKFLKARFSPGYGDFALTYQKYLFEVLAVSKNIGVTLTDSCMMVPTKSVTALVGICNSICEQENQGCENCSLKECLYRKVKK
jgi:hypothetical protein